MKKFVSVVAMLALVVVSLVSFTKTAHAESVKMIGVITKIDVAADKKSATVTLKDNKTSADVVILVKDDLTLGKFADHRIVYGDEIRCMYDVVAGQNVAKLFKKTAGC